jgi:hypothetical protein
MIIVDFNGVLIAQVATASKELGADVDLQAVKNYFFRELLNLKKKFSEYGEVVIACDTPNTWRKSYFPYYKIKRAETRKAMPFSWELVLEAIAAIQADIEEYFPYKLLKIDKCEADDIIAVVCRHVSGYKDGLALNSTPIMIISSDNDFRQLQVIPKLDQYSAASGKFVVESNPDQYLFEKILKGDAGDCVPNILSEDADIANGIRQSPITKGRIERWTEYYVNNNGDLHEELSAEKFLRNQTLMDLMNCVPKELEVEIINAFETTKPASKLKLQGYFIKNKMKALFEELQNF